MLSRLVALASVLCLVPAVAAAGWISEQESTAIHNGERLEPERSTAKIADNKMRIDQPQLVSIFDYGKGTLTLLNPETHVFWSGSVDEYVNETAQKRNESLRKRVGQDLADKKLSDFKIDLADLPEIKVERTDEAKQIAGHPTLKYVVLVDDQLFQEVWLTEDFNTNDDIDVDKFLDYQRRNSARMIGKSAKPFNALYRSKAYADMLRKGYALQTIIHHIAGGFERRTVSIKEADVPESAFSVPAGYRRGRIADVFPKEAKS